MVGYLSKKPKLSFVDDPGKLYRQRRGATQAKGLETLDSKAKIEGPSKSPRESQPPSPKEDQPQPPPMGEQSQLEREIKLCTPGIIDLHIINLQDTGRPFKIKVSTIRMTIVRALERFNEYIRARFLVWHIGLLKRRMEKMEIEKEAQHLKVAEARSTCKECEEYGHVQGKPRFNASSSIQDLVPLSTQFKNFMDEQAKINKDVVTKFEAMEKILKNLDGKVTGVGNSLREVFIMMKMLETQVGQLAGRPMGSKGEFPRQSQGCENEKAAQTHSGEMEDRTQETMKIMIEGPKFEIPSHCMKEVVAAVKTKGQSQPVKTKNMTKPKNKPMPRWCGSGYPRLQCPQRALIRCNQVKKSSHGL
jgi:hypothetical protein